jgi:hypothetical protein
VDSDSQFSQPQEEYQFGPDLWNVDNLISGWNTFPTIVDQDAIDSLEAGTLGLHQVPESSKGSIIVVYLPWWEFEDVGSGQTESFVYSVESIEIDDENSQRKVFVSLYAN